MSWLTRIPELAAQHEQRSLVRISPELDVPITPRVQTLIDTAPFRRLARVSQLGLVALVYPGATHTRFEHSLGVYRLMLLFLAQLHRDERFRQTVSEEQASLAIAAALLHDIAHWPYCHPIEDLGLPEIPHHEQLAERLLCDSELAEVLRREWRIEPADIARILRDEPRDAGERIIASLLSGPIDVDKMDYLQRDSLHSGVPYGKNFDQQRLIGSFCLNSTGDSLAITDKGRTAAEMLVFARYVMFSEVYWHHTVRAATAMLQHAFYRLRGRLDLATLLRADDAAWVQTVLWAAQEQSVEPMLQGLFGDKRVIYKRLAEYSILDCPELYARLARRPYPWLLELGTAFVEVCNRELGLALGPDEVLFDAPPTEREIEFDLDVYDPKTQQYRRLGERSPVVRTLAREQFDDHVKRVRIYIQPSWRSHLPSREALIPLVERALQNMKTNC
jgi:HD superfamily phosphohydrolase